MIGVEDGTVHGIKAAVGGACRAGHVGPLALLPLVPKLVGAAAAEVDIGEAVVVVVTPQGGIDVVHVCQRMLGCRLEPARARAQQHSIPCPARAGEHTRDEKIEMGITIDVADGDAWHFTRFDRAPHQRVLAVNQ